MAAYRLITIYYLLIQRDPCLVSSANSHAEIIWNIFVDIVQTTELLEQSSATAQGLTLCMCVCVTGIDAA